MRRSSWLWSVAVAVVVVTACDDFGSDPTTVPDDGGVSPGPPDASPPDASLDSEPPFGFVEDFEGAVDCSMLLAGTNADLATLDPTMNESRRCRICARGPGPFAVQLLRPADENAAVGDRIRFSAKARVSATASAGTNATARLASPNDSTASSEGIAVTLGLGVKDVSVTLDVTQSGTYVAQLRFQPPVSVLDGGADSADAGTKYPCVTIDDLTIAR